LSFIAGKAFARNSMEGGSAGVACEATRRS
jgi:hypothetical protein